MDGSGVPTNGTYLGDFLRNPHEKTNPMGFSAEVPGGPRDSSNVFSPCWLNAVFADSENAMVCWLLL